MIPANLIYRTNERKIAGVVNDINTLYIDFLKDDKSVNNFLTIEPENADFFSKGESPWLFSHQQSGRNLALNLQHIRNTKQTDKFGITTQLDELTFRLEQYNAVFDSLVYLVYKRGYRNFGLEGELSDYARLIEGAAGLTNRNIYQLRKFENDYFLDKDTATLASFKGYLYSLNKSLSSNKHLTVAEKEHTLAMVNNYGEAFLRLVKLDNQSGISKNRALRASLNEKTLQIQSLFTVLSKQSVKAQKSLISRLNVYYFLSLFLILAMAVVFSFIASKHVVFHLEALTNYISSLAKNKQDGHSIDLRNSAHEIKQIYKEFNNLLAQLKIWERQRDTAIQHADDNQQRYRELADMLPQSVFETDAYGNYTYVNKAWYNAFGYARMDLTEGLNLIETLVSESSEEDILGSKKIENSNFLAVRKNGTKFPASVYTDNILLNGKIAGRRGIIIDITERVNYIRTLQQETSRAKTSDELKSSFLANMSHEIRTPMNSIIGFSNLLASEQIPDIQKKDFTNYIRTSSEILLNLVDDIIDIAKIEAGELKIVKKDCELNALGSELMTTSEETRKRFNKQQIQLQFRPDPSIPEIFLKTDPFRLRQVLINLINNAIKFTDKGSVEFGYTVKEDTIIEFYVKDTGPGLTRDELDLIFERFKRARRSEEKNIVGTGLGLAIAKNLVQLMGGEMWVDSTAGVGTTFLFTLPYLRTTILPANRDSQIQSETDYNWKGKKILVVEDDLNSFKYLSELLGKTKVEIIHASNGHKAVEIVREDHTLDLVVMDIQLPVMDGLEATRLIKELNPHLPVIAQTAYAMSGDKEKMKHAGCDDYVPKPLNPKQILAIIHHYLFAEKKIGSSVNASLLSRQRIITN
jgi:PAS domain S-box-containing protein